MRIGIVLATIVVPPSDTVSTLGLAYYEGLNASSLLRPNPLAGSVVISSFALDRVG